MLELATGVVINIILSGWQGSARMILICSSEFSFLNEQNL